MANIRFLFYAGSIGAVFLVLTAIKSLSPEKENKIPVDEIGRRLYRPIFFGGKEELKTDPVARVEVENLEDNTSEAVEAEVAKSKVEKSETEEVKEETSPKKLPTKKPDEVKKKAVVETGDDSYFTNMIADYKANVLTKRKYRNDVVVRYYKHESDGDKAQELVDYGFYLHERPVAKSRYETTDSNIIYYGQNFPERDLKLITYVLVKNGIPIKRIQPFKNYDGWKINALEIGGDPTLKNKPTLTFSQISGYSKPE